MALFTFLENISTKLKSPRPNEGSLTYNYCN